MIMKTGFLTTALLASLAFAGSAEALPSLASAPLATTLDAPVEHAQFFGGPRCFYPDGWHGPGYYRCGFRYRRGSGFLGGRGFGGGRFVGGGGHFGGGHFGGGHHGGHGGGGHGGGRGGHR